MKNLMPWAVVALAFTLSSCSVELTTDDRPTEAELTEAITANYNLLLPTASMELTHDDALSCVGTELHQSDVSTATLKNYVDFMLVADESYEDFSEANNDWELFMDEQDTDEINLLMETIMGTEADLVEPVDCRDELLLAIQEEADEYAKRAPTSE